ncbi:hypothetical protein KKE68_06975, partial [Patescibacteria group bacterium]|nr:hypothetical protein [Patescibacteria group bacterium]
MSNLYLGSFVDKHSFIHSLDARIKIFYVVILSTLIFSVKKFPDTLIFTFVILFIISIAKMNTNYIVNNLRRFFSIFLFLFLMYIIFSSNKIFEGIIVMWQFLMLI